MAVNFFRIPTIYFTSWGVISLETLQQGSIDESVGSSEVRIVKSVIGIHKEGYNYWNVEMVEYWLLCVLYSYQFSRQYCMGVSIASLYSIVFLFPISLNLSLSSVDL